MATPSPSFWFRGCSWKKGKPMPDWTAADIERLNNLDTTLKEIYGPDYFEFVSLSRGEGCKTEKIGIKNYESLF